ncbi:uncharacterized protein LOC115355728 [Myripristis murdjan]|uniref:uncharacterized protein LOC115355728 n=1 Tax=Myripristis murdjan TaxID=586833 RepID=UPI0011763C6F|nr:uncharacterized protein LOC115355728 [Myripristis murdjan]XP_029902452.1 uncharacterized protein LOC115355728 [Myripristis murdjan]
MENPLNSNPSPSQTKAMKKCALCHVGYRNINQHLKDVHHIFDAEHRKALIGTGHLRYAGPLDCPMCSRKMIVRLDQHLKSMHHLEGEELKAKILLAKKKRITSNVRIHQTKFMLEQQKKRAAKRDTSHDSSMARQIIRLSERVTHLENTVQTIVTEMSQSYSTSRVPKKVVILSSSEDEVDSEKKRKKMTQKRRNPFVRRSESSVKATPSTSRAPAKAISVNDAGSQASDSSSDGQDSILSKVLTKFKSYFMGSNPNAKKLDNTVQTIKHINHFINLINTKHMSLGDVDEETIMDWCQSLAQAGYKLPTQKKYITSVRMFFQYIKERDIRELRVSQSHLYVFIDRLTCVLKGVRKGLVVHQQMVLADKRGRVMQADEILNFKSICTRGKIVDLLEMLEDDPESFTLRKSLVGHMVGYLCCLTGHRPCVFENLEREEVCSAEQDGNNYVIHVKHHKTMATHGRAQITLTPQEYGWFRQYAAIRPKLEGYSPNNPNFFFSRLGNPLKKLNDYFQTAWKDCGLPGQPTCGDVRTSMATHVQRNLSEKERKRVLKAMCHSQEVSDKFYVMEDSVREALATRKTMEKAINAQYCRNKIPQEQEQVDTGEEENNEGNSGNEESAASEDNNEKDDQRDTEGEPDREQSRHLDTELRNVERNGEETDSSIEDNSDEETYHDKLAKLFSPLPRRIVPCSGGTKTRRKLCYEEDFKDQVKQVFGELLSSRSRIPLAKINGLLKANQDLLGRCKQKNMTISNFVTLIKTLQREMTKTKR